MTTKSMSLDGVFDLLKSRRRRVALSVLERHGAPITLADLADEVAVLEHRSRLEEIPADEVMKVYLSLYHTHIPKLAEADIVTYDQAYDLVRVDDGFDQFATLLQRTAG